MELVRNFLFDKKDDKYREFQKKLIPNIPPESIVGVRTPELRAFAKKAVKEGWYIEFLDELPHKYFDENQLHSFIVSEIKDAEECMAEIKRFLPYVNNWATCDQLSPKCLKKDPTPVLSEYDKWLKSGKTYEVRFGVDMLMEHFLDERFKRIYIDKVSEVRSEEYYVNMMIAWYMATALAKQWDTAIEYIENKKLDIWTHNKAIQKARESFRITDEQKAYLNTLKIKGVK